MHFRRLNYERGIQCSSWHLPPSMAKPNPYEVANALTFTVVRHPLTKMLSQFEMSMDGKGPKKVSDPVALNFWLEKTLRHIIKYFRDESEVLQV